MERKTTGGFARGILIIEGFEEFQGKNLIINFQNEFLVARIKDSTGTEKVFPSSADFHGVTSTKTLLEIIIDTDNTFLSILGPLSSYSSLLNFQIMA